MQAVRPESAAARNDTSSQPRGAYGSAPDTVTHSMLGIGGLFEEMASYGISRAALIADAGIELAALDDPAARMTHRQKVFCFFAMCDACQLTRSLALLAGQRSAFQILVCSAMRWHLQPLSATLSPSAFDIRLAGPVLEKPSR